MNLSIVNNSTIVNNTNLTAYVAAQQLQINNDFGPAWGITANLVVNVTYNPTLPTIFILDNTTQAGVLGYHSIVNSGVPVGFVFAKTSVNQGFTWQSTASHEILELLADKWVNSANLSLLNNSPVWVALEVCDPVELDTYKINNISLSNFVLPTWYQFGLSPKPTKFDFMSKLHNPITVDSGGYFSYQRSAGNWLIKTNRQIFGDLHDNEYTRMYRRSGKIMSNITRDHTP